MRHRTRNRVRCGGFTLIEVMISLAVVAIALVALLSLQHQNLQSVIRAQEMTRAAMLAQSMMSQIEMGGFPPVATQNGDFQAMYRGQYPGFRWRRAVEPSAMFPDVRKITLTIFYGPGFHRRFEVVEFMYHPMPPEEAQ